MYACNFKVANESLEHFTEPGFPINLEMHETPARSHQTISVEHRRVADFSIADIPARASPTTHVEDDVSRKPHLAGFRSLLCSHFCDSCEFLWPALFVQVLFASQGLSGHKEAQNSQEEQSDQPRIDHLHHRRSTSRY